MKFLRHGFSAREIRVHHADQADGLALLRQLVVHTRMIAPKGAHADHSNGNEVLICQGKLRARRLGGGVKHTGYCMDSKMNLGY
jgi:hypothetical protein